MAISSQLLAVSIIGLSALVAVLWWRLCVNARTARRREEQLRAEIESLREHELRTPLHGLLALVELLRGTRLDDDQRRYVDLLAGSAHKLGGAVAADICTGEKTKENGDGADVIPPLPAGQRFLFVDDVELNRLVLREYMTGIECHVDEAEDGAQALEMVKAGRYDLIVLDLRMPVMDGYAAARAIRDREEAENLIPLPLVALSAGTSPREREEAIAAGFDLFLAKPIDRAGFVSALSDLLPTPSVSALPPPPAIPEGLEHMLPQFVAEMDKDTALLRQLVGDGVADELADHVHAMRGKCGMFGEEHLYGLLTRLEKQVKDGEGQPWPDLVSAVVERSAQLRVYGA